MSRTSKGDESPSVTSPIDERAALPEHLGVFIDESGANLFAPVRSLRLAAHEFTPTRITVGGGAGHRQNMAVWALGERRANSALRGVASRAGVALLKGVAARGLVMMRASLGCRMKSVVN